VKQTARPARLCGSWHHLLPLATPRYPDGFFLLVDPVLYRSPTFRDLKPSTQATRRNIITTFCEEHGNKPVRLLARRHVADIIGAKADTPMAAITKVPALPARSCGRTRHDRG
jgi:hypothetical protein